MKFVLDNENYYHARLGLIILQSDETIEQEIRTTLPSNISINHSRIPCNKIVSSENLSQMQIDLPTASELLPKITYDSIGYACTSGATIIGSSEVEKLINSKQESRLVTDPIKATKEALINLNCHNIAFVSPYEKSVTEAMRLNLHQDGFKIKDQISFNETDDTVVARIAEEDCLKAIIDIGRNDVDAIFISCTNLKTFNIIDKAEKILQKPVISSNQALIWHMLKSLNITKQGPGLLFRNN